jgi:hypothetical protein
MCTAYSKLGSCGCPLCGFQVEAAILDTGAAVVVEASWVPDGHCSDASTCREQSDIEHEYLKLYPGQPGDNDNDDVPIVDDVVLQKIQLVFPYTLHHWGIYVAEPHVGLVSELLPTSKMRDLAACAVVFVLAVHITCSSPMPG